MCSQRIHVCFAQARSAFVGDEAGGTFDEEGIMMPSLQEAQVALEAKALKQSPSADADPDEGENPESKGLANDLPGFRKPWHELATPAPPSSPGQPEKCCRLSYPNKLEHDGNRNEQIRA